MYQQSQILLPYRDNQVFEEQDFFFYQYTFQMWNLRPSFYWVLSKRLQSYIYTPLYVSLAHSNAFEDQINEIRDDPIFTQNVQILQLKQQRNIFIRLFQLLTPRSFGQQKVIIVNQGFTYPQSIIFVSLSTIIQVLAIDFYIRKLIPEIFLNDIAMYIGYFFYFVSIWQILDDFRLRFLEMRRGNYTFNKDIIQLKTVPEFLGNFISDTLFTFIIILVIVFVVVYLVTLIIILQLQWQIINYFLGYIIAAIIQFITKFCFQSLVFYQKPYHGIQRRRLYKYYYITISSMNTAQGLLAGFVQIFINAGCLIFLMIRIDLPIASESFYLKSILNKSHYSYLDVLYMHYLHNNPITVTFANLLKREILLSRTVVLTENEKQIYKRKRQIRNKLYLAFLLSQYPELNKLRQKQQEYLNQSNTQSSIDIQIQESKSINSNLQTLNENNSNINSFVNPEIVRQNEIDL